MKRSQTGITLIELMVTVAIIAVVASIAVPMYSGYIRSAYVSECSNEIAAIELAQNEFFLENNTYFGEGDVTIQDIEASSLGLYVSGYTVAGDPVASGNNINAAECTYAITAGATNDIATSYQITATGQNNLNGDGCISRKPIACP